MADAPPPLCPGCGGRSTVGGARERDGLLLPTANISRIMRKAIPPGGKIDEDAKEAVQACVSEASDKCRREKQEAMTGHDLLWAMATLGFQDYMNPSSSTCTSTDR
ncbi:nuclear transcription factor Y subunit B-1-like [Brachypodium distachyon]|uniref:nuclear transcription factor Y subunit B-1-like n=1 Tax=Brachypodium distachyon TaxID=15368 RepID=UPI000D0D2D06|nr:nuclear transcription factor Y subunit B-1-like [Brachypodium distachyon]|eukprot:XP_024317140.1 nuclear transcription factor Y subunit B-1-like [Brachypodium distachyon]